MRESHPALDRALPADAVLWRYLDFPKLVSLLKEGALWFSRADLLGDPLEGSFTLAREIERQRILDDPPEGRTRAVQEDIFKHNARVTAEARSMVYVNCWHQGSHESMALWQGYGGGPFAVALRSTFGLLDSLLPEKFSGSSIVAGGAAAAPDAKPPEAMPIYLTRVSYIDHSSTTERIKQETNLFSPFSCKSVSYSHESEVRGLYWNIPRFDPDTLRPVHPAGLFVSVDVQQLITDIVVSPIAPKWFAPVVGDMMAKYGYVFPMLPSLTSRDAVY